MNRRRFCRTALSAAVLTGIPMLTGARADTSIRAVSLHGREIELERAAIRELDGAMNGTVLLSGHPSYDSVRKIWNGMHDRRPALIARCRNSRDISHAVTFARERNLLLSVRGGGHSWPGKSVCDDGLMLDLADMRNVTVDPNARRAVAQGGALLGRRWFTALEPHTGGYYDNIEWDGDKTVTRNYGPNYARLSKIKGRYDPGNLFRMNSNILPT